MAPCVLPRPAPPTSVRATGDCRDDGDDVVVAHLRVQPLLEADVLVADEDVDEAPQLPVTVEEAVTEPRMLRVQLRDDVSEEASAGEHPPFDIRQERLAQAFELSESFRGLEAGRTRGVFPG
jgi:hypothetical protein